MDWDTEGFISRITVKIRDHLEASERLMSEDVVDRAQVHATLANAWAIMYLAERTALE